MNLAKNDKNRAKNATKGLKDRQKNFLEKITDISSAPLGVGGYKKIDTMILKIKFKGGIHMRFIRFGYIPENEKSIKYFEMTFTQNEDFTWFLENGYSVQESLEKAKITKDIFEDGVSCFYYTDRPQIDNIQQLESLHRRADMPCFVFDGDVVGTGTDNEPLVINIKNVEEIKFDADSFIENVLNEKYQSKAESEFAGFDVTNALKDDFFKIDRPHSVNFKNYLYTEPVEGFGIKRGVYAYRDR